jgi:hypothetical protein
MRRRGCEGRIGSFTQPIEHEAELREFAQDDSLDGTSIELPNPLTRGCLSLLDPCANRVEETAGQVVHSRCISQYPQPGYDYNDHHHS